MHKKSNNLPKVSVLMTVYNGEKFLEATINSVLAQSFKNFEFIIVNDGSTDKSEEIIKNYIKKDKRIVYVKNKVNKGFGNWHNILNSGLEIARGKYIARIDADDICYKDRIKIQYDYLEKNKEIFLIGASADVIDFNGRKVGEMNKRSWPARLMRYLIAIANPFIHSSIFFRNEGFRYLSKDEHVFYFNLSVYGKRFKNLSQKLIAYRINPEGLMAKNADLTNNIYKDLYLKK